jgi:hypothetical protein
MVDDDAQDSRPSEGWSNVLAAREEALMEYIGEELHRRDDQINDLKCQVAQLQQASNAEFLTKIQQSMEDFYRKFDAILNRYSELIRSADRRERLDLPPLPLTRRVN